MYSYKAYNFSIKTPFQCPQLLENDTDATGLFEISVRYGTVPCTLDDPVNIGPVFEASENVFLLKIEDVGRYLIINGSEIIIESAPAATENSLRLFLLGSAMGVLLNQRGYFVLHASAVVTDQGAILFTGLSGAGKSTTAQGFVQLGYQILSDDTVALYYDGKRNQVMVLPSFPSAKLWQKSADLLQKETIGLSKIVPEYDKYAFCTKIDFHNEAVPLHTIYHLKESNTDINVGQKELQLPEKFNLLLRHTYRRRYMEKLSYKQNHFKITAMIIKNSRIKQLTRPIERDTLSELIKLVENDLHL